MSVPDPSALVGGGDSLEAGLAAGFGAAPASESGASQRRSRDAGVELPPLGRTSYLIEGEIARGGMGVILRGRDPSLGREVAIKVLREDLMRRPDVLQRFVEEAQISGQLQHPGIVPVYEFGLLEEGRPFFAMKLIEGRTLAALLGDPPGGGRRELLDVFAAICQALAYAHARGVVHRDLKPSNVLIGEFGEVQVVDWGLAKVLGSSTGSPLPLPPEGPRPTPVIETLRTRSPSSGSHSTAGSVMGTPAYMSPEQARGELEGLDERSDVFSLGAILCEVLTGEPPYTSGPDRTLEQARQAKLDDADLRLAECAADAELVELCRQCLAPAAEDRPRSAGVLAERIQAYLASVEDRAHRARVHAAAARVRARAVALFCAAGVVLVLLGGGTWLRVQARRAERAEETERAVAAALEDAMLARGRRDWSAAEASLARAAARLEGGEGSEALLERVASLGATIGSEAAEARAAERLAADNVVLLAGLQDVRQPEGDTVYPTDWEELDRRYVALLEAHGTRLEGLSVEQATSTLAARGIALELASALDEWTGVRRRAGDAAGAERLMRIADTLDPDPTHRDLRAALSAGDLEHLRGVARGEGSAELTPATARLLANSLRTNGDSASALRFLLEARRRFPDDFGLAFETGRALRIVKPPRAAEAVLHYEVALALRPDSVEPWHELGMTLLSYLDRAPEALELFRRAVERRPEDGHLHFHVANVLTDLGRDEEAIASYERSIELEPDFALSHGDLGISLDRLGRSREAVESYERALVLEPDFMLAHFNLGYALRRLELFERAAGSFGRAAELEPGFARAHLEQGYVLYRLELTEEAVESYRRALAIDPAAPSGQRLLGRALEDLGRFPEAIEAYRQALRHQPSDHDTLRMASWLLATTAAGDPRRAEVAVEHARAALALSSGSADDQEVLGVALLAAGRPEQALEALERALELGGEDPTRRLFLSLCFARLDDEPEARAWFERARPDLEALLEALPTMAPFVAEARSRFEGD